MADTNNAPTNNLGTARVILDAAEQLCATQGIEAVSIRDIATAAGVSIAVIYHHYKSKANLLRAILHTRFAEIKEEHDRMLAELEAQESPAARDILRAVLQPINQWRNPDLRAAMQFYALALVCPLPEVKGRWCRRWAPTSRRTSPARLAGPHARGHLLAAALYDEDHAPDRVGRDTFVNHVQSRLQ